MDNIRITTIQSDLTWENPKANRAHFDNLISQIQGPTDVIVLPEMFTTGFSMKPETTAEKVTENSGPTLEWMREKAAATLAVICGSVAVKEGNEYYNRLYWVRPSGQMEYYDKKHLFSLGNEHEHYKAGHEKVVVEWKGWKFSLNICYDLRFPVWLRNYIKDAEPVFDVQLFVANWPKPRVNHWKKLLQARAIENQCYAIGVNRHGNDGNGMPHNGGSGIVDFNGEWLVAHEDDRTTIQTTSLSHEQLTAFRAKLPFLKDTFLEEE